MMAHSPRLVLCAAAAALVLTPIAAGAQAAAQTPMPRASPAALTLEVVLSRHQGDKRISNLPYTLSLNADDRPSQLRMGGQVPMLNATVQGDGKPPSVGYRDIGTSIDARATVLEDGRYRIGLTIEDTSVYADVDEKGVGPRIPGAPAFRSFRSANHLALRNGQTVEFTTAPDRLTGELVKVSVKLTVLP